jgi:hypothetical protein
MKHGHLIVAFTAVFGGFIGIAEAGSTHVRSHSAVITTLIEKASEQSATFRDLLETINASDGIVYVEEGDCRHGVRACVHTVMTAAGYRMLWVLVDSSRSVDLNLMGSIGHELRHAIEVLQEPSIKSNADLFFFYQCIGYHGTRNALETTAAVNAGNAVRAEVRAFQRKPSHF